MNQEQAIKHYIDNANGWVASHALIHHELYGVWVGNRGDRTARSFATKKMIERKQGSDLLLDGIETDHQDKPIEKRYAYFHKLTGQLNLI